MRRGKRDLAAFQDMMRGLLAENLNLDLTYFAGAAAQDVRRGKRDLRAFQDMMRELLAELRARGPLADDDTTVAAHLLRMRDPASGQPLSDDKLLPEVREYSMIGRSVNAILQIPSTPWLRLQPPAA